MRDPSYQLLVKDLEWVLSIGMTKCYRSTAGSMLERAQVLAYDSEGRRIPIVKDPWLVMPIKRDNNEPAYEMEFRDLFRIGRVTRALLAIERTDPTSASVLVSLYGDRGARWGRETYGREAAIYPLTKTGQALIANIRKRFPTSIEIRDDEVLVQDLVDQTRQPNDLRRRKHERMRLEADVLKTKAHSALSKVAA